MQLGLPRNWTVSSNFLANPNNLGRNRCANCGWKKIIIIKKKKKTPFIVLCCNEKICWNYSAVNTFWQDFLHLKGSSRNVRGDVSAEREG